MLIQLVHTIQCSEARFWALYADPAWSERMVLEGLGYSACKVQPVVETPTGFTRTLTMSPKVHLPEAAERVIGRSLAISEQGRYERATRTWHWQQRLSVLSDKIQISGTIHTEPDGPDRCRRLSDVNFEAKIFGIGGIIEKAATPNVKKGFDDAANWINQWLAKNPETPPPG